MADDQAEALKFWDQLHEFSRRYVRHELGFSTPISPWGLWRYSGDRPKGAIIHYTADEDLVRVLRWFLDEMLQARVSAHAVVADRRLGIHDKLASDLPLVQELPVTVVQIRQPDKQAWHATWVNGLAYGIENVNAGPLKMVKAPSGSFPGEFNTWRRQGRGSPEWTDPWRVPYKSAVKCNDRWWAPYLPSQIKANIILLRYLQQTFESLKRPWILGHEQVQRNKLDPGPTYPIHGVREATYGGWSSVRSYDWYRLYEIDRHYGRTTQDGVVTEYARLSGSSNPTPPPAVAWARFDSAIRALPDKSGEFGLAGKTALRLLGYYVRDLDGDLDGDELTSVRIFQRMMGVVVDGRPGRLTKRALVERLADRNLHLSP